MVLNFDENIGEINHWLFYRHANEIRAIWSFSLSDDADDLERWMMSQSYIRVSLYHELICGVAGELSLRIYVSSIDSAGSHGNAELSRQHYDTMALTLIQRIVALYQSETLKR